MEEITNDGQIFHFAWVKIENLVDLDLYPNFESQLSSQDLIDQDNCNILVNGGFYGQDNLPIGWFISQNQLISQPVKSTLFNGYLSLPAQAGLTDNQLSIDAIRPGHQVKFGLQSGPLLVFDYQQLLLKIKDDEPRRRLIAAQTGDNNLIFLVIVGQESLFTGPLLAQTPAIVMTIAEKIGENFIAALNLDGGSASAFYTPDIHIEEFTWIGSYFCLH